MKKLSREEIREKILKLDKFESISIYGWSIYIDGTGFVYDVYLGWWWKLIESGVYNYPVPDDFHGKIKKETVSFGTHGASSTEEVLEAVTDDIRDSILFNLNLFR